ncbi:MAG TPA: tRNA lysidine(34) synthetase TilS [Micromonosporaceae bacterium]|nr:tRNA lysidine(34) synthetase TilS [Micromonosporaceae bacterium]
MATLAPSVAAVRVAVRHALAGVRAEPGNNTVVLVACSGGADSLALAHAVAFVAPRLRIRAGLVTVDHGLQAGSADRAELVARWARSTGFEPVDVLRVDTTGRRGGPEAAARDARYAALRAAAHRHRGAAVLLGHTRDDQAETVLLALARGAGPRGLAGMPAARTVDGVALLRPLLDIGRAQTRDACRELGLAPWDDPHNADPAYARARVRTTALPALVAALGPDVVGNLARTAALLAADTATLDELAGVATDSVRTGDGGLSVPGLAGLPAAVRTRVLHGWARALGVPGGALSYRHVTALDALVVDWHGQGRVDLPGGVGVVRLGDRLQTVEAS